MKVKDLITKLQGLNPNKDIHIIYDSYCELSFNIHVAKEGDDVKEGDYIIYAG